MEEEKKFIEKYIVGDTPCVLALSGGPDSMCLLHLLYSLHKNVICVHINHKTRKECEEEYAFVKNYLQKLNIPLVYHEINSYEKGKFTENEARQIRYQKFLEVCHEYHSNILLTAHHGDDLTETILMRLLRGSSLKGYAAIKQVSNYEDVTLLRPLLTRNKKEIYSYLKKQNIPFVHDKSNDSNDYIRNRIRHEILPLLEKENPYYYQKFLSFSEILQEKTSLIDEEISKVKKDVLVNDRIDITRFKNYSKAMQTAFCEDYLYQIYQENITKLTKKHLNIFMNLLLSKKDNAYYEFPMDYLFIKNEGYAFLKRKEIIKPFCYLLEDYLVLDDKSVVEKKEKYTEKSNFEIHLNSKDITLPLYIKSRENGMKMEVKNLNGTRKINDILIDNKLTKEEKDRMPILVDSSGKVLWILGIKKSKYDIDKDKSYDIIYKYKKKEEEK